VVVALCETVIGLSWSLGTSVGGAMYTSFKGNFAAPPVLCAALMLNSIVLTVAWIRARARRTPVGKALIAADAAGSEDAAPSTVSVMNPAVVVTAIGTFLAYAGADAPTPIGEDAWKQAPFFLSIDSVGYYLAGAGFAYMIATLPTGYLVDVLTAAPPTPPVDAATPAANDPPPVARLKLLMALGALLNIVGCVLIGPLANALAKSAVTVNDPPLGPRVATFLGLTVIGLATALMIVPGQPDMLLSAQTSPPSEADAVHVAALWVGMYNGGMAAAYLWARPVFLSSEKGLLHPAYVMMGLSIFNCVQLTLGARLPPRRRALADDLADLPHMSGYDDRSLRDDSAANTSITSLRVEGADDDMP
jgi:hypothetical protein